MLYPKQQTMAAQKRRKIWIWLAGIFGVLVLIIGVAALIINAKWKPTLTAKLKEGVYEGSDHLYSLNFKDIRLNIITGSVVLDDVSLYPDSAVFEQLKSVRKAPAHLFRIKLAHLKISRVGILTAYFKKRLNVNSIVLDHPSIDMVYQKVPKRIDTVKDDRTLYQQISKSLKSISIYAVKVVDADFDYYNGLKKLNSVKHLSINVNDILIDSLSQFDTTRVFHSKEIAFGLSGYSSITKDKMYALKIDSIKGSLSKKTISISGIKLTPQYPDLTFSRKYATQKDRYDLNFKKINFSGVDFIGLNSDGDLRAKKITIGESRVAVFLNRELPPPNFDKGRNYPHEALKRLPIPTIVDTLSLKNVAIAYTEYDPKNKDRGTLHLENLHGNILNLTNDSLRLTKYNHAYANLTTYIMGKGKLNVKIDFNLTSPNAAFTYVGHVEPFDLKILNPLSKSLGMVAIESGKVRSVDFTVSANLRSSSGTVKFAYNDLKVDLLKEDEDTNVKKKKGFLSFLANTVLIKNDNPTKGDAIRISKVTYQRLPQASFFNLMWKSVFVGIRETVGIGAIPMKPMKAPKGK